MKDLFSIVSKNQDVSLAEIINGGELFPAAGEPVAVQFHFPYFVRGVWYQQNFRVTTYELIIKRLLQQE